MAKVRETLDIKKRPDWITNPQSNGRPFKILDFPGIASQTSLKMQIAAAYTEALIRADWLLLLCLKMQIVSFCSTLLKYFRMFD